MQLRRECSDRDCLAGAGWSPDERDISAEPARHGVTLLLAEAGALERNSFAPRHGET